MFFSFLVALLHVLGMFGAPAMDSYPASATSASASWAVDTATDEPDCTFYLVPETDEGLARSQELQAAGWYGDPTDGMEALYPPAC